MDRIHDYIQTKRQRFIINNWRLFFNVNTLAEISNYAGNTINKEILDKHSVVHYKTKSHMLWPIQEQSNINNFNIWVEYIYQVSKCNKNGALKYNLGEWMVDPSKYIKSTHGFIVTYHILY
jgi:hypothetical protein